MASCFDFRMRTSSFDLHQLSQRRKLIKISKLFRTRSEDSVKDKGDSPKSSPKQSPRESPKGSPSDVVRRRFVRVVRNEESAGEEYENPHIIRRYTQDFLQEQWSQRVSGSFDEDNLPYSVSGHTILKKHSSTERTESPTGSDDQVQDRKHASFKEEVQIIEFDKKGKVKACSICTHTERLQDSDDEEISSDICRHCQMKGKEECPHLSSESELSDSEQVPELQQTHVTMDQTVSSTEFVHAKDSSVNSIVEKIVNIHIDLEESERSRVMPVVLPR